MHVTKKNLKIQLCYRTYYYSNIIPVCRILVCYNLRTSFFFWIDFYNCLVMQVWIYSTWRQFRCQNVRQVGQILIWWGGINLQIDSIPKVSRRFLLALDNYKHFVSFFDFDGITEDVHIFYPIPPQILISNDYVN